MQAPQQREDKQMSSIISTRDIIIQTNQPDEARKFYTQTLGLTLFDDNPTMRGIETGAFRLFIEPGPLPGPVFEFLVDDVQATKARLLAAGCTLEQEDPSLPRCYIRDPFGLVFNLHERSR
jgi:catechol 2,3-dioxygenase-like lactoylglutathione lyase family enzyme